jgi:cob(I)alamin adenosyltransferase
MALFTGKGDGGTSKLFTTPQGERLSKSSTIFEALGAVDEINSFLGMCKVVGDQANYHIAHYDRSFHDVVHSIQKNLFIVQAELAGSQISIGEEKVKELEAIVEAVERELPPIKTFFISGGTFLGSLFDTSRVISRRAERLLVRASEEGVVLGIYTKAYMNRLSSVLYALARLSNHLSGVEDVPPDYS